MFPDTNRHMSVTGPYMKLYDKEYMQENWTCFSLSLVKHQFLTGYTRTMSYIIFIQTSWDLSLLYIYRSLPNTKFAHSQGPAITRKYDTSRLANLANQRVPLNCRHIF